jgi:predicted glycosyltransferase
MAQRKRRALHRAARNGRLTLVEFTPDLVSYLAAADLVVSMAGYNTTCEILSLGKRALFIPRVQVRAEQRMRAERLSAQGMAHMLLPDDLTPERLMDKVQASRAAPDPTVTLDMNGLPRVSEAIANLLANKSLCEMKEMTKT